MIVSYLPDPEQHPLWPAIKELLKPAADYGGIPVRDDDEFVWIAFEGPTVFAAMTTLLWNDGEAEIRLASGTRLNEWVADFEGQVSAWAKRCGAAKLTMRGRKGWARFQRAFGWASLGTDNDGLTMFEKDLASG